MAGKRTRKQKKKAVAGRGEKLNYSLSENQVVAESVSKNSQNKIKVVSTRKSENELNSFYQSINFDKKLVIQDLAKTVLVTAIVLGVLIAYTIYYR